MKRLAAIVLSLTTSLAALPVQAATEITPAPAARPSAPVVELAQAGPPYWRHHRHGPPRRHHWRHHRHHGDGAAAAIIGGLAAGAILGGAMHQRPRVYRGTNAHVQWCYDHYRSYRAYDNTYQPYEGPRRQCYSPYD
ncbi:BA14K family protein [Allorhizobium sp. BGMRC 0089]|uniref:BA14K family protein n=1 Tax=Allorhizobium sonneratiae TaxID=2934936 RepID=UPI002034269E|nr:BA14K family protein [Allorhizobium sonneratiae]MCM2293239.1 BA14K family protein [Allorhizobium sonneratiae]